MNALATQPTLTRDLLTGMEWNAAAIRQLYHLAGDVKARPDNYRAALRGRFLAMIFEKPSLRTRVSFEVGIQSLGGSAIFLDHTSSRLGVRESIQDVAKSLERWVQGIVARTFEQDSLDELASYASIPVINALSDRFHPCQALADFFTLQERFGNLRGLKMAYLGDGNNVCHSLLLTGVQLGVEMRVATPKGYGPDREIVAEARRLCRETGAKIDLLHSAVEAVTGAQAVYTDVWASMGQEELAAVRAPIFAPFQVNETLLSLASRESVFLHCLPAHRGAEVTSGVIDSPRSLVYDQAENRLHLQKAILLMLLS